MLTDVAETILDKLTRSSIELYQAKQKLEACRNETERDALQQSINELAPKVEELAAEWDRVRAKLS